MIGGGARYETGVKPIFASHFQPHTEQRRVYIPRALRGYYFTLGDIQLSQRSTNGNYFNPASSGGHMTDGTTRGYFESTYFTPTRRHPPCPASLKHNYPAPHTRSPSVSLAVASQCLGQASGRNQKKAFSRLGRGATHETKKPRYTEIGKRRQSETYFSVDSPLVSRAFEAIYIVGESKNESEAAGGGQGGKARLGVKSVSSYHRLGTVRTVP